MRLFVSGAAVTAFVLLPDRSSRSFCFGFGLSGLTRVTPISSSLSLSLRHRDVRLPTFSPVATHGAAVLRAIIYGPDGERVTSEEDWQVDDDANAFGFGMISVAESLSQQIGTDALARIGSSFAPPPHDAIRPSDVMGAHIVSVESGCVDISVGLSSEGQVGGGSGGQYAVQILVRVEFPNPCNDGKKSWEVCALENLRLLDSQAQEKMVAAKQLQDQQAGDTERLNAQRRIIQALQTEPTGYEGDSAPDWWTYPDLNFSLEEECTMLKGMLNEEEFAADLGAFFEKRFNDRDEGPIAVAKACVASVGPSGIFLRAFAGRGGGTDDERYGNEVLAVRFDGGEARSPDALREQVLQMVQSPSEMQPEEIVVVAEVTAEVDKKMKQELFQRSLLTNRLRYDRSAVISMTKVSAAEAVDLSSVTLSPATSSGYDSKGETREATRDKEAFQRKLLECTLQTARAANRKVVTKKREVFQRSLLESQMRYLYNRNARGITFPEEVAEVRRQPKSPEKEAALAKKYAAFDDVGERAYVILKDLRMV